MTSGVELVGGVALKDPVCRETHCQLHLKIDPAAPGVQEVAVHLTDRQGRPAYARPTAGN